MTDANEKPTAEAIIQQPAAPPSGTPSAVSVAQPPIQVSKLRFILIFLCLMLCVFLFALDQLIVATAIPHIVDQFHSLEEISWIANGFFLTLLAFNLLFAQWLAIFPAKHVTLFAVAIFEVGSLLCGVAPNMPVLILGRAIAGLGGTGIFNGALMILTELTTFQERAKYFGLMGVCFAVASILGPLVGGAFSDHISWRWCFYINLPIGGIALFLLTVLTDTNPPYGRADTYKGYSRNMLKALANCDWVGAAIVLSWGCCFILALEWGGITKAWSDPNVIACLVMIPVLAVTFFLWERYYGNKAMLPLHMLKNKNVIGAAIVAIFTWAVFMLTVYYIAEMYQAVYGSSATKAGIDLLPQIVTQIFILISTGRIIAKFGKPYWIIVSGPVFLAIGSGLLYTIRWQDGKKYPMGYSSLIGVGIGMVLQNTIIAIQYEYHKEPRLIATATGVVTFFGFVGRNLGISLGGSIFGNMLQVNIHKGVPSLPNGLLLDILNNANAVYQSVPQALRSPALDAYTKTLNQVFLIGVPASIIALAGALLMTNVTMEHAQPGASIPRPKDPETGSAISSTASATNEQAQEEAFSRRQPTGDVEKQ